MSHDNPDLLDRLTEELEQAWNDRRDHELVDRLAAEHPALAFHLYEFFADVVEAGLDADRPRPEYIAADERAKAWLEREGFKKVADAFQVIGATPSPPSTPSFLKLLRDITKKRTPELANALDVPGDFLVGASENPKVLPQATRLEFARRAHQKLGVDQQRSLVALTGGVTRYQTAASRPKAYSSSSITYTDLVNHSALTDDQKLYWLSFRDRSSD